VQQQLKLGETGARCGPGVLQCELAGEAAFGAASAAAFARQQLGVAAGVSELTTKFPASAPLASAPLPWANFGKQHTPTGMACTSAATRTRKLATKFPMTLFYG